jgi:hypothetical protein
MGRRGVAEKGQGVATLPAAAALAKYDQESDKWAKASVLIVHDLVQQNPVYLLYWTEAFRSVRASVLAPLSELFRDHRHEQTVERFLAINLLADWDFCFSGAGAKKYVRNAAH